VENFSRTKFLQNSFNGESITETAARFAETDQRTARVGDAFFCGAKSFRRQRLTLPRAGLRMARCMLRGDVSRLVALTKPEWRNWQTRWIQNPVSLNGCVGSSPSSGNLLCIHGRRADLVPPKSCFLVRHAGRKGSALKRRIASIEWSSSAPSAWKRRARGGTIAV
jgi:hypothetical protein